MPLFAADLHIHTVLSPCGDDDMTPNNIVNMAALKGLDIIAVTDHNSAGNAGAVISCGTAKEVMVIPGIEVETAEEVHLLCLFKSLDNAYEMQKTIASGLPNIKNRESIYGKQLYMDANDVVTGIEEQMLVTASVLSVEDVFRNVLDLGGAVIPAHIDRDSYSILSNLGNVPNLPGLKYLELSSNCDYSGFMAKHPELCNYRFIRSSDAHSLGSIMEREFLLELEEKSADCLISTFSNR